MGSTTRNYTLILGLAVLLAPQDCFGPEPPAGAPARLRVYAQVPATVTTMVVEVTASDIDTPLVFNIDIVDGTAGATIQVPSGTDRTVTGHAYDGGGIETHRGSVTVDVYPGLINNPVQLTLDPLSGDQPITITLGGMRVQITPDSATLTPGSTVTLSATITDGAGNVVHAEPTWATGNPAVATVTGGTVTAVSAGTALIHATYQATTAQATVTVNPQT